jgi:hypothetical protein
MKFYRIAGWCVLILLLATLACQATALFELQASQAKGKGVDIPIFEYDPSWPKPLPNNWITGNFGGMYIDSKDHIWVFHRPGTTTGNSERYGLTGEGECCFPAPPVLEFDLAGNLLQAWGPIHEPNGQLVGKQVWGPFPDVEWPRSEHGIFVDYKDNVWLSSEAEPSQVLKFTRDGKFLMRIGKEQGKSSNDTTNLGGPAGLVVDPKTNELYVADGYKNRRVIVFDADTGVYKRHWGAYGKRPADGPQHGSPSGPPVEDPSTFTQQFRLVHCVVQSKDGLLYVCDRRNNRIQVFRTDGTFVKQGLIAPQSLGFGAVHTIAFSPDREQRFLYVADGANKKIWTLRREDLAILDSFGHGGRAGGQFILAHAIATDSHGNIYLGESIGNGRVQRFKFVGMRSSTSH